MHMYMDKPKNEIKTPIQKKNTASKIFDKNYTSITSKLGVNWYDNKQQEPNRTGIPDETNNDVQVYYNSDKPAQLRNQTSVHSNDAKVVQMQKGIPNGTIVKSVSTTGDIPRIGRVIEERAETYMLTSESGEVIEVPEQITVPIVKDDRSSEIIASVLTNGILSPHDRSTLGLSASRTTSDALSDHYKQSPTVNVNIFLLQADKIIETVNKLIYAHTANSAIPISLEDGELTKTDISSGLNIEGLNSEATANAVETLNKMGMSEEVAGEAWPAILNMQKKREIQQLKVEKLLPMLREIFEKRAQHSMLVIASTDLQDDTDVVHEESVPSISPENFKLILIPKSIPKPEGRYITVGNVPKEITLSSQYFFSGSIENISISLMVPNYAGALEMLLPKLEQNKRYIAHLVRL